jgi:stage II sporulation protein D
MVTRVLATALLLSSVSAEAALSPDGVSVRVRLAEAAPVAEIRGAEVKLQRAPASAREWKLRCEAGQVRAVSEGGRSVALREPVTVQSGNGFLFFQGKPYRGEIQVWSSGSRCEVVNVVDLERYLDGLVNAEFSSKWSEAAIDAQVIAARSYALYQIRYGHGDVSRAHFDVDATVRDQVYDGPMREDSRASRAVRETRGEVLLVSGTPMKAFYHSTCGGMTEVPEHVWGAPFPGFHHGVSCPFCGSSPRFSWSLDVSPGELAAAFLRGAGADGAQPGWPADWASWLRDGKLAGVRAEHWDSERRVSRVTTSWVRAGRRAELTLSGARLREWLGPARFRSAAFDVSLQVRSAGAGAGDRTRGGGWHFAGRGNGHGVGMCQWGAKVMGERGYTTASILKFYYPEATVRKLY